MIVLNPRALKIARKAVSDRCRADMKKGFERHSCADLEELFLVTYLKAVVIELEGIEA